MVPKTSGFNSRRSTVYSTKGMVSSTQPLATAAGLKVLEKGGNAAMAAVAVAAAIGVTEPMMNSIGGDAFALYYDAETKTVKGLNGSGKTPSSASLEKLEQEGVKPGSRIPGTSIHSVTVPGAVAAWEDVLKEWGNGKLSMAEVVQPAIDLAENGFPVSELTSKMWQSGVSKLRTASPNGHELLTKSNEAPKEGELFVNKGLAKVLRKIAKEGKDGFYKGETADAIIDIVKENGGVMTHEDLAGHTTKFVDPISIEYQDVKLHEIPPNGQGIVALQTLGIIRQLAKRGVVNLRTVPHNSAEYLHLLAETLKFSFKDGEEYITDVDKLDYDPIDLLSDEYLNKRADLFDPNQVNHKYDSGVLNPDRKSDTVYFTTVDSQGNACSFITSIYTTFGSGIVPAGCGFPLQNRGCNFNTTRGTRNCYAGGKRPYHTIIPAAITKANGDLYAAYGVMGGFMQPQGHVQVLNNMVLYGMNPQQALDAPRICLTEDSDYPDSGLGADSPVSTSGRTILAVEEGISESVVEELKKYGHKVRVVGGTERSMLFGRGQVLKRLEDNVWGGGSDPRGDGAAVSEL